MERHVLIAYGDGKELGDFSIFARTLKRDLDGKFDKIRTLYMNRDHQLFDFIKSVPPAKARIAELHIFTHAIGAGVFLGYGDDYIAIARARVARIARARRSPVTYEEAINTEVGGILTDDLSPSGKFSHHKDEARRRFAKGAFIKLWGCNAAVENHRYSGEYWEALNLKNTPKPSIAQAMADFFNITVYGASSGASIEVRANTGWTSTQVYKDAQGRWPSGTLPHRLVPDRGTYRAYNP